MELILDRELSCGVKEKSSTRGNPNLGVLEELRRKKEKKACKREREEMERERAEEPMERTGVTEGWNVQSERENGGGELRRKKGESGLREREKMRKKSALRNRWRERG